MAISLLIIFFGTQNPIMHGESLDKIPIILNDRSQRVEYNSLIKNRENWMSYSSYSLKKLFENSPKSKILNLFKEAKLSQLYGMPSEAIKKYRKIIEFMYHFDWENNYKEIILTSLFILAKNEPRRSQQWLIKAKYYKPEWNPDQRTFSDALISQFKSIPVEKKNYRLQPLGNPIYVVVNGEVIPTEAKSHVKLPTKNSRIVFIYNSNPPLFFINTLVIEPQSIGTDFGSCEIPLFPQWDNLPQNYKIFYSKQCILEKTTPESKLTTKKIDPSTQKNPDVSLEGKIKRVNSHKKSNILHSKWFWGSLMGSAILLYHFKKQSQRRVPDAAPPENQPEFIYEGY